ncbi:MAG TPA: sigma-70 family RNA polymerase sigma factor [Caldilineaceae bacterium]|nr:sigma-70 family RNA polymerase sigma factor [Caldilineaceae bacterium]
MSESELIERARRGDEAAWVELVRRHQGAIFRLAYLLLGNQENAKDVAQEVFLRAYCALDRFDRGRPLRPWLLEITRNQASNWRRSLRRYLAALGRWGQTESVVVDPRQEAAGGMDAQTLWQAVRRLNRADQEVIYLRYFLELSVEETAQSLQVAPGTVKSRLARALERLRNLVEAEFPGLREEVAE